MAKKATKADLLGELDSLLGDGPEENNDDEETIGEADDTTDDEGAGEGDGESENTDGEGDSDAGGEEPDDTEEGAGGGTEVDDAAAAAAATDPARNPDGTFKSKEQLEAEKKKQPDPVNDPIPENLKKETRERIQSLITTTKSVTQERDHIRGQFDTIVQGIQATGTTPDQYQELLSFMSLFNSPDPAQKEQALNVARGFVEQLGLLLGKDVSFSDPLEQHPDLKQAIAQGQITKDWATQLARQRMSQQFRTNIQQHANQQQNQQQQAETELRQARMTLTNYETQLRQQDPLYEAKKAYLMPILKPLFATINPRDWPQQFANAYQSIPAAMVAQMQQQARTAASAGNKRQQGKTMPLRAGKGNPGGGGSGAGGMKTKAKTPMDALNEGLAQLK